MLTMKTRLLLGAIIPVAVVIPATAGGQTEAPVAPEQQAKVVVTTEKVRPKRKMVLNSAFHPAAYPSPSEVPAIIASEAGRVGASVSGLMGRVRCESGFSWRATNGQYSGVGQFAYETFYRGLRSLDTRIVKKVKKRWRARRVILIDTYSDGSTQKRRGWRVRQLVVHHYRGRIPRNAPVRHTYAQIRIMALAMVGRSGVNDSEWSCR